MPLGPSVQGFGILGAHPPPFDPVTQLEEALQFYNEHGYVVVRQLDERELAELNGACDLIHRERGSEIDVPGQGKLFFPLLLWPEFDFTVFHPRTLPLVSRILGGQDKARHIEFNYRAWEPAAATSATPADDDCQRHQHPHRPHPMSFHSDDCSGGTLTLEERQQRRPYGPPDMLQTFTYLTDVDDRSPAFAVVPKSRRIDNVQRLREALGDGVYCEVPIVGPAGTCCIVDRHLIHTRLDPRETDPAKQRGRRILHHVFSRAGELRNADGTVRAGDGQALEVTEWAFPRGLMPERLVRSPDPAVRRMFSARPAHQVEWMERHGCNDFDAFVSDPKAARGPTRRPWKRSAEGYNSEGSR
eukprot:g1480.t1